MLGGGTTNWSTNSNWNTGTAPSATNHAVVPAGAVPYPELTVSSAISNIDLQTGTSLSIGNNTLTVNGTVSGSGSLIGSNSSGLFINAPAGTINFLNTGTNNYLKYFTIANGASATLGNELNITAGASANNEGVLTVTGTGILTTGGFLTIKSNQYGTARIAQGKASGGYISGNATVERYIPQNGNKAWRMLATNTSTQTIKEAWQENQPSLTNGHPGYGIMVTNRLATLNDAQAAGFDTLSNSPSLYSFSSSSGNWIAVTNTNAKLFSSEEGYFVFIRGDRSAGQFNAYSAPVASTILRSKGILYQGSQPVKNVTAGKYLLLRNPYASAIDLRNITTGGGLVDAFQVWDPKLTGTAGNGAYQTLTRVGANYVVTPGGGSYPASGSINNTVESGAAFIVQATGTDGTVQVLETSKTSGSNLVFRPASPQIDDIKIISNLYADNSSHQLVDGNMILFDDTNNNNIDKYDVRKLLNMGESFSVSNSSSELVVERRKLPAINDTIEYKMRSLKKMNYEMEFITDNIEIPGLYGYVEDKYTNTGIFLNPSGRTLFNFSVNNDSASFVANRFRIVFRPFSVLPLSFINVNITRQNNDNILTWKVANELNISHYEVEKSFDGISFSIIGSINQENKAMYNFVDQNNSKETCYYRIKSKGNNSQNLYSKIVKITYGSLQPAITLSPNPVTGNFIKIKFEKPQAGKFDIVINNSFGQQVYKTFVRHIGGDFDKKFDLAENIPFGIYDLKITMPDHTIRVEKLLIGNSR